MLFKKRDSRLVYDYFDPIDWFVFKCFRILIYFRPYEFVDARILELDYLDPLCIVSSSLRDESTVLCDSVSCYTDSYDVPLPGMLFHRRRYEFVH